MRTVEIVDIGHARLFWLPNKLAYLADKGTQEVRTLSAEQAKAILDEFELHAADFPRD